jgi:hypothetical protein
MHSAILLLLVASGLLGVALSQTPTTVEHETSKWVKSTEQPTKPKEPFWSSSISPESTATVTNKLKFLTTTNLRSGTPMDCEQTLKDPVTIDLTSVSDSIPEPQLGKILIKGVPCGGCISKPSPDHPDYKIGYAICLFHPVTGQIRDQRNFTIGESEYFLTYMETLPQWAAVAGITCGDANTVLDDKAKLLLKVLTNVQLDNVKQVTFVVQPNDASKGLMDTDTTGVKELNNKYQTKAGGTILDYFFEKSEGTLSG